MLMIFWSVTSPAEPCTPTVPFPLLHSPKEQRLGPTPAESAREGGRHPSGLPERGGGLVLKLTHVRLAGLQGWDHPATHCPWFPLRVKAGVRSSQTVSWKLARIKKPMYASCEPQPELL